MSSDRFSPGLAPSVFVIRHDDVIRPWQVPVNRAAVHMPG